MASLSTARPDFQSSAVSARHMLAEAKTSGHTRGLGEQNQLKPARRGLDGFPKFAVTRPASIC